MQTFAEIFGVNPGQSYLAFGNVARGAEKTPRAAAIVAMVDAWKAVIFVFSRAFTITHEGASADGTRIVLKRAQRVKRFRTNASAPLAHSRVGGIEFGWVAFCFRPNSLVAFSPESLVVRFAFGDVFGGVVAGASTFFSRSRLSGSPTAFALFFLVFVVPFFCFEAVGGPLFRGAVAFSH